MVYEASRVAVPHHDPVHLADAMSDLQHWARCPDAEIDLARAALAIARDEYPDLDEIACLARLDAMATAAQRRAGRGAHGDTLLAALDHELFRVQGFTGNARAYYDPRNSYLNQVLERRTGIPITLSLVYLEVGWRLGLALDPLGFPGHFLVGQRGAGQVRVIDPFNRGRRPDEAELLGWLAGAVGPGAARAALPAALAPVPRREVAARMLRNLKAIHVRAGDWARALRAADGLVALSPEAPAEQRDRGAIYERLEAWRAAFEDYRAYLERAPQAADGAAVRQRIAAIRTRATRLN